MSKRIYVENLPFSASDEEIRAAFSRFGRVVAVNLAGLNRSTHGFNPRIEGLWRADHTAEGGTVTFDVRIVRDQPVALLGANERFLDQHPVLASNLTRVGGDTRTSRRSGAVVEDGTPSYAEPAGSSAWILAAIACTSSRTRSRLPLHRRPISSSA